MSIYRIKQFMWSITSKFKPIDEKIVKKYLNTNEQELFNKLGKCEKHHSIRVCNEALLQYRTTAQTLDRKKLAKIALLHDVGKSVGKLNVIDKSVLVILDKVTNGRIKKYKYNTKIDIYYNHPKKSVNLLKNIDKYDKEFLQAIEEHHYKKVSSNIYLNIIKQSDDKC